MKLKIGDKKKKILGIVIIVTACLLLSLVGIFIGRPFIRFLSEPEKFRLWVNSHSVLGRIVYVFMTAFQTVIAVIPGEPFEIAAGYAFGAFEGTFLCVFAEGIGSVIIFAVVRKFGMKVAEIFFDREKLESAKFLKTSRKKNEILLLIFMLPGTPKDLICCYAGMTDISFPVWLLIAFFGRIPSVITSTLGGNAIFHENYLFAVLVFAGTFVISIIGFLIYDKITKKKK